MKKPEKIKAVLFDLDGVLIDSEASMLEVFSRLLTEIGLKKVDKKKLHAVRMLGSRTILERFLKGTDKEHLLDDYGRIRKRMVSLTLESVPQIKLARNAKKIVDGIKLKKALVTNRGKTTHAILEYFGISFDVVVTARDVENMKPHPEPIFKALKKLKVKPEEAIFVGDTQADADAARAAGVFSVIIGKEAKGDVNVKNLGEVSRFLSAKPSN